MYFFFLVTPTKDQVMNDLGDKRSLKGAKTTKNQNHISTVTNLEFIIVQSQDMDPLVEESTTRLI